MRLGLIVAAGLSFAAAPAAAAPPVAARAAPCLEETDFALCLLRAAGSESVTLDPELAEQPELLKAAGLRSAPDRAEQLSPPYDTIISVVREVRALDRAGRPPAEALAPLTRLDDVGPIIPPAPAPRLFAYGSLASPAPHPSDALSPPLEAAVLRLWEQVLVQSPDGSHLMGGPRDLAVSYHHAGDDIGALRAAGLETDIGERVKILIQIDQLEAATELAAGLTAAELLPAVRARAERVAEVRRQISEQFISALTRQSSTNGRDTAALTRFLAGAEPERPPSEAELEHTAAAEVSEVRWSVIEAAAKTGQPQAARVLADQELRTHPALLSDGETYRRSAALAAAASPAQMTAWLEALQDKALRGLPRSPEAAYALPALAEGWAALGRRDRLEVLLAQVRPQAEKVLPSKDFQPLGYGARAILVALGRADEGFTLYPGTPEERLANDIKQGRGVAQLDSYLAETAPELRMSLAVRCADIASRANALDLPPQCLARAEPLADTASKRMQLAEDMLRNGAHAARNGALPVADQLARQALALALASGLDADRQDIFGPSFLIEIAKAELRASDRLPPRPEGQMMLGRVP